MLCVFYQLVFFFLEPLNTNRMNNLTFYTVCASCTTEFLEQFHIEKM